MIQQSGVLKLNDFLQAPTPTNFFQNQKRLKIPKIIMVSQVMEHPKFDFY